jgi:hypothetical protein
MLPVTPATNGLVVAATKSVVPVSVTVPVSRRSPMTTGPHPMVIAPSQAATNPDVPRHRASRRDLNDGCRHWRRHDNGRRRDDNGRRNRNSQVDTESNPGIYRGGRNSGQGQNCDCLFHNV